MKNLTNKTKIILRVFCYLGLALFTNSCKDNDTPPQCGCESATSNTVPSKNFPEVPVEKQKSGFLFYKTSQKVDGFYDDEQYNNRFWIFQGTEGCYNCRRNHIICNESLLGAEFDYLKNSNDSIEVKFTGNLKNMCVLKPILADLFYAEIKLTSIKNSNSK